VGRAQGRESHHPDGRRVVVAEMQHITYNEWLPIVLGMKYMMKHSMEPTEQGFIDTYNPQVPALSGLNIL